MVAYPATSTINGTSLETLLIHRSAYRANILPLSRSADRPLFSLFCKDKNGVLTRTNYLFAESLNLKKENLIGKTAFDLFPKDQAESFQKDDLEVINSGKPKLNIEEPADFTDRKIWAITNKTPSFNKDGDVIGIIGLAIDITERKKIEQNLKESEEKFRSIAEHSLMGIQILQDNLVQYVNQRTADLF